MRVDQAKLSRAIDQNNTRNGDFRPQTGDRVSAFVSYLFPGADLVSGLLTAPATIGELWIIGYLIIVGVRDHPEAPEPAK